MGTSCRQNCLMSMLYIDTRVMHGWDWSSRSLPHTHTTGHELPHRHVDPLPDRPWWSWPRLTALCQFYFLENSHGVDWCVASLSWDGIFSPGFMDPILGLFLLAPFSAGLASRLRVCLKIILLLFKKQQHYNTSGSKAAILGYIGHCSKAMFVIPSCHTSVDIKAESETPSRHTLEAFLHGTDRLQTEVLRIQRLPITEDAKPGWIELLLYWYWYR